MSGYLLDTGVFLLSFTAPERLNNEAREILENAENDLYLSAASSWEISIKSRLGKLKLPEPASVYVPKRMNARAIRPVHITNLHGLIAGELPPHHQDPFDRMLIAQAMNERLVLMTTDRLFEKYGVEICWCSA